METYKDHITLTPDMNEERLNTLRELFPGKAILISTKSRKPSIRTALKRLNDTSSVGLANQQPSVMPLRLHVLRYITMLNVVSMLTLQTTSSLKVKTSKFLRFYLQAIGER